jgi:hypothetical protein
MRYIYTIEYYSATRNNDMWLESKWIELEDIMLSEPRLRKTEAACFLSSVKDKSKT